MDSRLSFVLVQELFKVHFLCYAYPKYFWRETGSFRSYCFTGT